MFIQAGRQQFNYLILLSYTMLCEFIYLLIIIYGVICVIRHNAVKKNARKICNTRVVVGCPVYTRAKSSLQDTISLSHL